MATSVGTIVSFPIPPYSNLPINANYYLPSRFVISGITLGIQTTVTTSVNHNYVVGQLVRLLVPVSFGSWQLNEQTGYVFSIPNPNQVVVSIDSRQANLFVVSTASTKPEILAIGDINSGVVNNNGRTSTGTFIPGSFINISPL